MTDALHESTHLDTMSLIRRAQAGDAQALDALIMGNMPLVISIARRFEGRGAETEDLRQIGCMGLLKAVRGFDTTLNLKLSTYAVPLIIGEIRRHLRDNGKVHVARSIQDNARRLRTLTQTLEETLGREPTVAELSGASGLTLEDTMLAVGSTRTVRSLEEPVSDASASDPITLRETLAQPESMEWTQRLALKQMLSGLNARDYEIVVGRFFSEHTQSEIASKLGMSQAQVSRLEKRILARMREEMEPAG